MNVSLDRNQFPTQPLTKPAIPSWQMKEKPSSHNANSPSQPTAELGDSDDDDDSVEKDDDSTRTSDKDFHGGESFHMNGFASVGNDSQD